MVVWSAPDDIILAYSSQFIAFDINNKSFFISITFNSI